MKKNKAKVLKQLKELPLVFLIPILLCAMILPCIVFLKENPVDTNIKAFWAQDTNYDFFSYYKMLYLNIFASIALIFWFFKIYIYDFKNKVDLLYKKYIYLFVSFGLLVVFSSIFSKYQKVSFIGYPDRYEGMFTLLSYIAIFFVTTQLFKSDKQKKYLIWALFTSGILVSILGAFQFFGMDLFKTDFGKELILPIERHDLVSVLKFNFKEYTIYSTLFNTNYVGSFIALFFPFTLILFIKEKRMSYKGLYALLSMLFFVNLVGCRSRSGIVGVSFALSLVFLIYVLNVIKNRRLIPSWSTYFLSLGKNTIYLVILSGCFTGIYYMMDYASGKALTNNYGTLKKEANKFISSVPQARLKNIILDGKKFTIVTEKCTLVGVMDESFLYFADELGNKLKIINDGTQIKMEDKKYQAVTIKYVKEKSLFNIKVAQYQIGIVYDNGFKMIGSQGLLSEITKVEHKFFEGKETLGSKRGYIWSRSIPLLKKTLFLGNGPDTFTLFFPQDDYFGKTIAYSNANIIVDKPHNMFLQIALNSGIISLFIFLLLMTLFVFDSIRYYVLSGNINNIALLSSIVAYLGAGLFNDSLVSVAPIFYLFLGLGVTYFVKKDKEKV